MIQFGNDKIEEIYHGSDEIKEIYYGSELVWSGSKPSYMILTDDTRIDFEIENAPIANFCKSQPGVVINGVSYTKEDFKEIHFGTSYSGVTEIGSYFLYSFRGLTNLTLDFPALNSVSGSYFMYACIALTNLTLNFPVLTSVNGSFLNNCGGLINLTLNFPALNSVGSNFLRQCTSLTTVTLTAETPPNTSSSYFLNSTSKLLSIYVPPVSVQAYKTTSPWSSKSSLIKAI